jgi:uncharacterized protein (TIGR03435 family)
MSFPESPKEETMLRSVCYASVCGVLISLVVFGQALPSTDRPSFEVATIKLTDPSFPGAVVGGFRVGRFTAQGFALKDLIGYAYDVDNRQIVGGPKWSDSERYDVVGKPEKAGPLSPDAGKLMLRTLLSERFQLKIHRDMKEMPVYILAVAGSGLKMKRRADGDANAPGGMPIAGAKIPGRNTTIQFLAYGLQELLDRPVLDKTGVTGRFDFDLSWRPDPSQFRGNGDKVPSNPDDPDLFTALQQQLGLKLTAERAPAEVIVVDSAEKPSEN